MLVVLFHKMSILRFGIQGLDQRDHDHAGETGCKAVIIKIQSRHRAGGLQHQSRVDKARRKAERPAEVAGDGGKGGDEQGGYLHRY